MIGVWTSRDTVHSTVHTHTSKKILCITTMDKRSTDRKSTNLEKACFLRGMQFFKDKGIKVVEVLIDAHVLIASVMSMIIKFINY